MTQKKRRSKTLHHVTCRRGSWDEFLKIHADTLWQCDFLSKPMWTAKGLVDVYLLVFLHLRSRRVWISPSTVQPDSAWVSLQARNFLMVAEDMGLAPEYVLRDNDRKFWAALGFWKALEKVFPTTRVQRCTVHKTANVLDKMPKSAQPQAKRMLHSIWDAPKKEEALKAFDLFLPGRNSLHDTSKNVAPFPMTQVI